MKYRRARVIVVHALDIYGADDYHDVCCRIDHGRGGDHDDLDVVRARIIGGAPSSNIFLYLPFVRKSDINGGNGWWLTGCFRHVACKLALHHEMSILPRNKRALNIKIYGIIIYYISNSQFYR